MASVVAGTIPATSSSGGYMRHTTTAAAVAVLLLALTTTACSSSSDSGDGKPAATSATAASASADPAGPYLKTAHDVPFTGSGPTDQELTALPPQWCAGLDAGHSVEWLFSGGGGGLYPNGVGWGTVKRDAYTLLAAGVKAYCPKHTPAMLDELRATGEY